MSDRLSPIVIFAYNRKTHLEMCLKHLWNNKEFKLSNVFIFCDGPKDKIDEAKVSEVRTYLSRTKLPKNTKITFSEVNKDLAKSVLNGMDSVFEVNEKAIVLEDDILVSNNFLSYMNNSLYKYSCSSKAGSITGYWYPTKKHKARLLKRDYSKSFFIPSASSWSWGTWSTVWHKFRSYRFDAEGIKRDKQKLYDFDLEGSYSFSSLLNAQLSSNSKISSWAILWRWFLFDSNLLTLHPDVSMVNNIGFDGSGRHFNSSNSKSTIFNNPKNDDWEQVSIDYYPDSVNIDFDKLNELKSFLKGRTKLGNGASKLSRIKNYVKKIF